MKLVKAIKVIGVLGIVCFRLAGCFYNAGIFNIGKWDMPDDPQFIYTVEALNNPCGCSSYMKSHFKYEYHADEAINPYELWLTELGDCNDFWTNNNYLHDN